MGPVGECAPVLLDGRSGQISRYFLLPLLEHPPAVVHALRSEQNQKVSWLTPAEGFSGRGVERIVPHEPAPALDKSLPGGINLGG